MFIHWFNVRSLANHIIIKFAFFFPISESGVIRFHWAGICSGRSVSYCNSVIRFEGFALKKNDLKKREHRLDTIEIVTAGEIQQVLASTHQYFWEIAGLRSAPVHNLIYH